MTNTAHKPLKVFCSYSHEDEKSVNKLRDFLRGPEREQLIKLWHDREIAAGSGWNETIEANLRAADIILLLVTQDFLASDYVYDKEINIALERHNRGDARVIPIILRPADWKSAGFGDLQALPKDAQPIITWNHTDEAWLDVVRGIRKVVTTLREERSGQGEKAISTQHTQPRDNSTDPHEDVEEQDSLQRYREGVEWAWADREIDRREVEWLRNLAKEIGIPPSIAADMEREVMGEAKEAHMERQEVVARERYREAVKEAWRDKKLRTEEVEQLAALASELGLSTDTTGDIEREVAGGTIRAILQWQASEREQHQRLERGRKAATLYEQGSRHMDAKEWQQARKCFEELEQLDPNYRNTKELLVQVRQQLTRGPGQWSRIIRASNIARVRCLRPPLQGEETTEVFSLAFSPPHGKLLAAGEEGDPHHTVEVWSMEDRRSVLRRLEEFVPGNVVSVAFSPNGQLFAAGGPSRTGTDLEQIATKVRIWPVDTWDSPSELRGGDVGKNIVCVAFNPDPAEALLATCSVDEGLLLWQIEDRELRFVRKLQEEGVIDEPTTVAFSQKEKLLAAGTRDGLVRIWWWVDGILGHTLYEHEGAVSSVAFSPDGTLLASASENEQKVRLWQVAEWKELFPLEGHEGAVRSVAFSPDGDLIASGSTDETIRIWQVNDGELLRTLDEHDGAVSDVTFSPNGKLFASTSANERQVRLWGLR